MILDEIVAEKKKEIEQARQALTQDELVKGASACFGQIRSLKLALSQPGRMKLIAEIKKASPSRGVLRKDFKPVEIARSYEAAGACALSILTDKKFFQGDLANLKAVRKAVGLPILRKDFIIDEYQIYESVLSGADSVLLIAQLLTAKQLRDFYSLCTQVNLEAVCEVHSEEDLDKVLGTEISIIGINNRNLQTFEEDLQVSAQLKKRIPADKIVISESAIKTARDVKFLQDLGVNAVLIGEAFMRSENIEAKVKELMQW